MCSPARAVTQSFHLLVDDKKEANSGFTMGYNPDRVPILNQEMHFCCAWINFVTDTSAKHKRELTIAARPFSFHMDAFLSTVQDCTILISMP